MTKAYTVDRFLEDLKIRYGGIDSVLMWPVYTQIGVDDQNQFDMWRSMPGGLEGVANLTAQLHIHGVKMLWPNKPWDLGTRYEPAGRPGLSDTDAKVYATLLKQTDGDGLNGDTPATSVIVNPSTFTDCWPRSARMSLISSLCFFIASFSAFCCPASCSYSFSFFISLARTCPVIFTSCVVVAVTVGIIFSP